MLRPAADDRHTSDELSRGPATPRPLRPEAARPGVPSRVGRRTPARSRAIWRFVVIAGEPPDLDRLGGPEHLEPVPTRVWTRSLGIRNGPKPLDSHPCQRK